MGKGNGPFSLLIGIGIGSLGGFLLGALLGKQLVHVISLVAGLVDRRGSDDERVRFELLSQ